MTPKHTLKACPFCGENKDPFAPTLRAGYSYFWVKCSCGAKTELYLTSNSAITKWNTRADESLKAQNEKLRGALEALAQSRALGLAEHEIIIKALKQE